MNQDEEEIRRLIEEWASAVHRGDLAAVVRDHADDLVMYDVPPPYEGLRGLDAYRAVWPGFFAWQASGAEFSVLPAQNATGNVAPKTRVPFVSGLMAATMTISSGERQAEIR